MDKTIVIALGVFVIFGGILAVALGTGLMGNRIDNALIGTLFQNGSRALTANWDQGPYNITNNGGWFLGKTLWSQIDDKPTVLNGTNGSTWFNGAGAPGSGTGVSGDYYLNVSNGDVYRKAGSWSVIGNILGPQGIQGNTGATGPQGNSTYTNANPPWYDSGLVAYWQMNEGSGTSLADDSGNSNTGTLGASTAAPTWIQAKYNSGLSFDGSNDVVTVSDSSSLDLTHTFTISFWFKSGGTQTDYCGFFNKGIGGGTNTLYYLIEKDSTNAIIGYISNGTATKAIQRPCDYSDTITWHFVCFRATGSQLKFRLDSGDATPVTQTVDCQTGSGKLYIGEFYGGTYFKGIIDDVRIYNYALSDAQMSLLQVGYYNSYSSQFWFKTTNNILYQRNMINSAWLDTKIQQSSGFSVSTPSMVNNTDITNTNAFPVKTYILTVGTTTSFTLTDQAGTTQTMTSTLFAGMEITLEPLEKIKFVYSVAPTWKWYGLG